MAIGPQLRTGCFLTSAAGVKHLLVTWDHRTRVPVTVFPETLLSFGHHRQGAAIGGREERSLETLPHGSLAALPTAALRGPANPASNALYTELGRTLPVFDGRCPPSTMPEVFPQPWRGALTEGWGPRAPFPSHSSWPGSLRGHRALPPSPCPLGDSRAGVHVARVGLGRTLQTLGPNTVSSLKSEAIAPKSSMGAG